MATINGTSPFYPLLESDMLSDLYPLLNSVAYPLDWADHRFQVLGVRDLAVQPLSVERFIHRPYMRRSRYMLRAVDLNTGNKRTIYHRLLGSTYRETPLRVGVFFGNKLIELQKQNWGATVGDRRGLVKFLGRYVGHNWGPYKIGILSDDGESITEASLNRPHSQLRRVG